MCVSPRQEAVVGSRRLTLWRGRVQWPFFETVPKRDNRRPRSWPETGPEDRPSLHRVSAASAAADAYRATRPRPAAGRRETRPRASMTADTPVLAARNTGKPLLGGAQSCQRQMLPRPREGAEPCVVGDMHHPVGAGVERADIAGKDRLVADHRERVAQNRAEIQPTRPLPWAIATGQHRSQRGDAHPVREDPRRAGILEWHKVMLVVDGGERPAAIDKRKAVARGKAFHPLGADQDGRSTGGDRQLHPRGRRNAPAGPGRLVSGQTIRSGAPRSGSGARAVRSRPRCQKTGIMSCRHFRCCGALGWIRRTTGASVSATGAGAAGKTYAGRGVQATPRRRAMHGAG